jgi:hypothetical protein
MRCVIEIRRGAVLYGKYSQRSTPAILLQGTLLQQSAFVMQS